MSRKVAVGCHAVLWIVAGALYFLFVLPRWWELTGVTPHTLGTVLRIVAGALIGLAALPVVFTLLRTRRPEFGTPQLALTLRTASIFLHVLAGVLIIGTAIIEIWISLDRAGRWLFGIYGAAAALAVLGIFAFYLAFVAELPPPPPKPLKPKAQKRQRRRRRKAAEEAEEAEGEDETTAVDGEEPSEAVAPAEAEDQQRDEQPAEVTAEKTDSVDSLADETTTDDQTESAETETSEETPGDVDAAEETNGGLRNRRTPGKISLRRRRRSRGGVAVED